MTIYCAREFSAADLQSIRDLIAQNPKLQRSALSRKLCQLWGWTKPNGELKDMTCRVALLRMQADGLITLPPSRIGVVRKRAHFAPTSASDAQAPIKQPVHEIGRITLEMVSGTVTSRLWNEYVARYHYLGYTPMSGSQIRYNVFAGEQLVACISFCAGRSSGLASPAAKAKTAVAKIATDIRAMIFFIGCSFRFGVMARCCETGTD